VIVSDGGVAGVDGNGPMGKVDHQLRDHWSKKYRGGGGSKSQVWSVMAIIGLVGHVEGVDWKMMNCVDLHQVGR